MCLPIQAFRIEREWQHAGLQCAVTQNREGWSRCGYVRVPPGHPAYGVDYDDLDVEVHGGLTFGTREPCTTHADGQGWWFGFDCGHFMDAHFDPNLKPENCTDPESATVLRIHREIMGRQLDARFGEHWWLEEEVAQEVERLAEQLALMGQPKTFPSV